LTTTVFQAPGNDEWRVGKAIQPTIKPGGSAGRRIEMSWERSHKQRTDFDIINSVQCFPGNEGKRDFVPDAMSIYSCSQRLENILKSHSYEKIVVFGDIAKQVIATNCKKLGIMTKIIIGTHPNGGVFRESLDVLWK
jgi:uracil-DNA glycosylase